MSNAQTTVVDGNAQNDPQVHVPRTRSTFGLKYHLFDTHRFGEYHPHYVEDGVKGDDLPIRSSHSVLSYTLKAPLMQSIDMYKDYFLVPREAILPLNWDKVFVNPVRGDDVAHDVGTSVSGFWERVRVVVSRLNLSLAAIGSGSTYTDEQRLTAILRWLVTLEYFYSNGSLMTSLGAHGAPYIHILDTSLPVNNQVVSFDTLFDNVIGQLVTNSVGFRFVVDGTYYFVGKPNRPYDGSYISIRHALALMRDNPTFVISQVDNYDFSRFISEIFSRYTITVRGSQAPFDIARLWAYQLVCAHYYTNDHIDFVYSANLYRELIGNYLLGVERASSNASYLTNMTFVYNGIKYEYDWLSARGFFRVAVSFSGASAEANSVAYLTDSQNERSLGLLGYFSALFAYRRSLRYQDYFTGSRTQPLAVGTTGIAVSNNSVSVIDVTRNIQRQRFLNAVNRVRHSFEGYLASIFGGDVPAPDYHNPFRLASTRDTVYGDETGNTGAAQMSDKLAITSNLRSNGSRYQITSHCDRPCIVIGITRYDIARAYTKTIERQFFHADRYDMFNPFMQYIGDQPIYQQELGLSVPNQVALGNFAYTLRHMEYKQRYHQAAGGFVEHLPGFAFLGAEERGDSYVITPDFIRSVPSEFDNFYVSLTGYSNGSYWHFIVDNYNDCEASRPMAYAPSIL